MQNLEIYIFVFIFLVIDVAYIYHVNKKATAFQKANGDLYREKLELRKDLGKLKQELEKKKDPCNEFKALVADLMYSDALIKISRVDASSLFQHSPRDTP